MNGEMLFLAGVLLGAASLVGLTIGLVAVGMQVYHEVRRRERKSDRLPTD